MQVHPETQEVEEEAKHELRLFGVPEEGGRRLSATLSATVPVELDADAPEGSEATQLKTWDLGAVLSSRDGLRTAGHGGSVAGYNANLAFDPATGWGVAMLRTTGYNPPTRDLLVRIVEADTAR